jgi:hypothetical protein
MVFSRAQAREWVFAKVFEVDPDIDIGHYQTRDHVFTNR